MAYPEVAAPYGLNPVNLIGGQVYAGSTRSLPIQYGYGVNIFFGDLVVLSRGFITRAAVSTGTASNQVTGVFLGVSYTNPQTKQKQFSQYWPASTLAGDAMAVICDDPDAVFKMAVCSSGVNIASGAGLRPSLTGIQAYTAAKHALVGLTKQLSQDLGPSGVTCNAIAPGLFPTEGMSARHSEGSVLDSSFMNP
jgi:NAD(P)-dependent dehydrogenase (short-subunit alcohol dehydrogenase family)